jgi:hypothetical protein
MKFQTGSLNKPQVSIMQKTSNLQQDMQLQSWDTMQKTSGKDEFKNIFSNLQHQDQIITTTDETFSTR